jgi:PAS domain S-box-containing protein
MNNPRYDLFLLATNLSQLKSKDQIIKLFIECIDSVFPDFNFTWDSVNEKLSNQKIEVCTRLKTFGFITFNKRLNEDIESFSLIQNLSQLVAVFLEKAEQEELLASNELKLLNLLQEETFNLHQSEIELYETNEIFNNFMINSPIYVFFKDSENRSLRLSKNFEQMLGRPLEELVGKNMYDLFPSDFAEKMIVDDKRVLNGGKSEIIEEELDGKYYTTIKFPIVIDGKPKYLAGYTIDITDRKKTEKVLEVNQSKYQSIFESTGTATLIVEADTTISMANHECFFLTGYSPAELIGHKWTEYVDPESLQNMIRNHNMRREDPSLAPKKYEVKLIHKKGETRHSILDIGIVKETGQSIVSILDISDRIIAEQALEERTKELQKELEERKVAEKELKKSHKQLEVSKLEALTLLEDIKTEMDQRQEAEEIVRRRSEELRLSEEKFKKFFEFASVGKSLTSLDGTVNVNKAFCKLLGYTKKEMKNINWRKLTYSDDILKNEEITNSILNGDKRSARWEKRYIKKNGEIVWVDLSTTLQRDQKGKPDYFITTVIDITEKKRAEEEIIQLNSELEKRVKERTSQLEEANKELQAFAYSVSHDLRAPLRAINGFSEFIVEDYGPKLDTEGKRILSLIRSNTRKMDQLITDILSLSRVARGEHKISKVDMTKMAKSMLSETASPEIRKNIRLSIGALPEALADPTFIKQVWINLISNAIKFSSGKKKPVIEIGGYSENESNIYYIKDNGVGFNPEYTHKLFGVFQRLHQSDEFEGTGVGLAIVQRIVHRHGGKVWA